MFIFKHVTLVPHFIASYLHDLLACFKNFVCLFFMDIYLFMYSHFNQQIHILIFPYFCTSVIG